MGKILTMILLLSAFFVKAQEKYKLVLPCGTKDPVKPKMISKEEMGRFLRIASVSEPYCVKVYITVFADNNGENRATTDADILRQFHNMVLQYRNHNICFVLIGIRHLDNSDWNVQDTDNEEGEMNDIKVANCFNIFIHKELLNSAGTWGGWGYDIPHTSAFVSLSGGNVTSTANISTMGHEVGHAFGLHHTFAYGDENVARAGNCKNCDTNGDLLCDTPADDNGGVNNACVYVGTKKDDCNEAYQPLTNNMMAYGNDDCRNTFTYGQGQRMRYFIVNEEGFQAVLAQNNETVFLPQTISSGIGWGVARDVFLIQPAISSIVINGTANYTYQSKRIVIEPGTRFSPSAGGKVHLKVNPYCN